MIIDEDDNKLDDDDNYVSEINFRISKKKRKKRNKMEVREKEREGLKRVCSLNKYWENTQTPIEIDQVYLYNYMSHEKL